MAVFRKRARATFILIALSAYLMNGRSVMTLEVQGSSAPIETTHQIEDFGKWAFTQGGLALVLIVVLWSYRRDFGRIQEKDGADAGILAELVGSARAEIQSSRDNGAAVAKALEALANEIRSSRRS